MKCDGCGKEMSPKTENGETIIGCCIQSKADRMNEEAIEYVQAQFGKYELNREYNFCYECWLDSLMGVKQ